METSFSADSVHEFLKLIVEIGDVHYVDSESCIRRKSDETPVGVKVNGGKDGNKLIALYKENMELDTSKVLLNPFTEVLGRFPEKDWFFGFMGVLPGALLKEQMKAMAQLAMSKDKDAGFKAAAVMSKFIERIDNKFINELEKIRGVDVAMIFYSKEKHIAQLNSALWEDEFAERMKSKLRKSSLMLIRDMVSTLLDCERPESIIYTATLIGCPQFDATVHVLSDVLNRIGPSFKKITEVDLHEKEISDHLQHLEAYHKAMQWLATSSASPVKDTKTVTTVSEMKSTPWSASATMTGPRTSGSLNSGSTVTIINQPPTVTPTSVPAITMQQQYCQPSTGDATTTVSAAVMSGGMSAVMPTFRALMNPSVPQMPNAGMMGGMSMMPMMSNMGAPMMTMTGGCSMGYGMPMRPML